MLINIELLEGATLEYEGVFYTAYLNDLRLEIRETFTGLSAPSSDIEKAILKAMISEIESMEKGRD